MAKDNVKVAIGADDTEFNRKMNAMMSRLGSLKSLAAGITAGAVFGAAMKGAERNSTMLSMSQRSGLSAGDLTQFGRIGLAGGISARDAQESAVRATQALRLWQRQASGSIAGASKGASQIKSIAMAARTPMEYYRRVSQFAQSNRALLPDIASASGFTEDMLLVPPTAQLPNIAMAPSALQQQQGRNVVASRGAMQETQANAMATRTNILARGAGYAYDIGNQMMVNAATQPVSHLAMLAVSPIGFLGGQLYNAIVNHEQAKSAPSSGDIR